MVLLYILATIAVATMARPLYLAAVRNVQAWQARDAFWQTLILLLSSSLLCLVALTWLYLGFVTLGSWYTSLDASRPKPPFILLWLIGLFVYGFGINFVGSLHSLAMRDYRKDTFWS